MRTPALFAIVVALHVVAVGAFIFIQGCGTGRPGVEPPPAPAMPSKAAPDTEPSVMTGSSVFQPPVPVEAAPAMEELGPGQTYVVKKGDTLSGIAARYGVRTRALADINKLQKLNSIRIGQKLILPGHATSQPVAAGRPRTVAAAAPPGGSVYVVQKGDSLSKIAARQGTTVRALRDANKLTSDKILIGQKLVIAGGEKSEPAAPAPAPEPASSGRRTIELRVPEPEESSLDSPKPYMYAVSDGDTLDSVARNFVVLKEDLMEANGIAEDIELEPGQKLIIPMPGTL